MVTLAGIYRALLQFTDYGNAANGSSRKDFKPLPAIVSALFFLYAAPLQAALTVEIQTGYNLVVDSNVTSPSTYAPDTAMVGAEICNTDASSTLNNVLVHIGDQASGAPGVYPVLDSASLNSSVYQDAYNTGNYSLTHEGGRAGTADATRFFRTIGPGECRTVYWLISYPQCVNVYDAGSSSWVPDDRPCATSITGGIKPYDDITLDYDVWATADVVGTTTASSGFTMRNEISAAANKIWPNTTSKVPQEYLDAIESVIGWGTIGPDGQPLTDANPIYPGQRVITTQGIWYDMGNVGEGFDNDGDLIPDHNLWMQPVGDSSSFDASCFRLIRTYGLVIVKTNSGDVLIPFENQLYFEHIPENTGVTGLVYYQFIALREGCSAKMTPYQEAASGRDNEKFCSDFGVSNDLYSEEFSSSFVTKTDGVTSVAPDGTLTYVVTATNDSGVNLGAPDFGMQLVFRDTIPEGTAYIAGTADDAQIKPTGTGSFLKGYMDEDGNLDNCTINYQVDDANTSYSIFYSGDNGATWSSTEPGTVTDIQWHLFTTINLDGSHDGIDCVAPNGAYDDGAEETSIPGNASAPYATAGVQFQVTVDTFADPIVCNTALMGFGNPDTGKEASDCTLVTGNNTLGGTVFVDAGTGTATFGDGVQNNTTDEPGIGDPPPDGVIVTLYYDLNGNGLYDNGDIEYGTTETDANGDYSFSSLPDGSYLVEVKKYDGSAAPGDSDKNAVVDFYAGYGNTTKDPNLDTATNNGIIKMTEDPAAVTLAVNIDLNHLDSNPTNISTVDFGFAPPLYINKMIADSVSSVDEGDIFDYNIILENRLPSIGRQGPTGCEYVVWASAGATGAQTKAFTNPAKAYDSVAPNRTVASAAVEGGANRWLYGTTYDIPQKPGNITKLEGLFFSYFNVPLDDDYLDLRLGAPSSGAVSVGQGGITGVGVSPISQISTAQIESYIGEAPTTDPNEAISWDMSARKPNGTGSVTDWSWSDLPALYLQVNPGKVAGADGKIYYVDAIGLRVTTDADCTANSSTTLSPVPLLDTYNTTSFDYVSAEPPPASVNIATGEITWNDVGPILPGGSTTVTVTVQARNVTGSVTGTCSGSKDGCNSVTTDSAGMDVLYADGRLANDGSDEVYVDIITGKGELRGTVWSDSNNNGWPINAGEPGLPGVPVTLFACVKADGTFETSTQNKRCSQVTATNSWQIIKTTVTNASGAYEFIGLDQAYYIIEIGDTDGLAALAAGGGNTSPYGGSQTAEPNDIQTPLSSGNAVGTNGICAVNCNNSWGNRDSTLNTLNLLNSPTSEEIINGINFGYYIPNAVIKGKVWHDVDGDAEYPPEPGETGLAGFTVQLYHDTGGDGTPDAGSPLATTATDSNGNYSFSGLSPDDFVINVIPPALPHNVWGETHESTGGAADLNNQIPVTVSAGEFSTDHDFGYTKTSVSNIGDTLYYDFDGDGNQGATEQGIPNVTVSLYKDVDKDGTIDAGVDNLIATVVTDADGNYLFEDLPYGSYVVQVDVTDPDFPDNVAYTGDPDTNSANIGNLVWLDANDNGAPDAGEQGIPGVVVLLYEDTDPTDGNLNTSVDNQIAAVTTNLNGNYLFTRLKVGAYFIEIDETTLPGSGLVRTTTDPATIQLNITDRSSTSIDNADAGYSLASATNLYAIGNRVWSDDDGDGVQDQGEGGMKGVDVTVQLSSCYPACPTTYTGTTDASGYYLVTGLANGTYTVSVDTTDIPGTFKPTAPAGSPANTATKIISGADDMTADFGYRYDTDGNVLTDDPGDPVGKISGTICNDASGNNECDAGEGMDAVIVNLYNNSYELIATTLSDANGLYDFTGVALGIYMVEAIHVTGTYTTTFLASGSEYNNLDIVYNPAKKSTYDNQAGALVSGVYDDLTIDFGYQRFKGSIGDTVFQDVNQNGEQDFGEPGIAGVTVELYLDANNNGAAEAGELQGSTATTSDDPLTAADEGGKYLFSNLDVPPAGQYYIIKVDTTTLPGTPTLIVDPDTDGIPCAALPSPDDPDDAFPDPAVCDSQQTITAFSDGINYLASDFGYAIAGAGYGIIGDTLWIDTNGDGDPANESGIPFVTVYIDSNANGSFDPADDPWVETDISGYYAFTNLADGTYTVKVLALKANDPDWPDDTLVATYEAGGSLDNSVSVVIASGVVISIDSTGCTDCELATDFGYRYAGDNSLAGTTCIDSVLLPSPDGYCGDNDTDQSGVNASETALDGVQLLIYKWNDDGDNTAWDGSGKLDSAAGNDTFVFLGNGYTDANGDYTFTNLPDDIIVVFTRLATDNQLLTTTNALTSVEDIGVASYQLYNGTTAYNGNTVTILARQALDLSGDSDNAVVDLDYTFDSTLGGTIGYDFGDLPAVYNNTLLADGGAQHTVPLNAGTGLPDPDLLLGGAISVEDDGQESATASLDANDDSVVPFNIGSWNEGVNGGAVQVTVSDSRTLPAPTAWLVGWMDFKNDGDFSDTGEMIISQAVSNGTVLIRFDIPNNGLSNPTAFARFRLFPSRPAIPVLSYKGVADNGEVEDYQFNFDATRIIGDRVWLDEDADGFQDIGEPGLAGVTVVLHLDADNSGTINAGDTNLGTAITDADGRYIFDNLDDGDYLVEVTDAYTRLTGLEITPGSTDPHDVALAQNDTEYRDADFGYVPSDPLDDGDSLSAIGDFVWNDVNADGIQDSGEIGIAGVNMALVSAPGADGIFGTTDDTVVATTLTHDDGLYLFTGVTPGDYVVIADIGVNNIPDNGIGDDGLLTETPTVGPQSEGSLISDPLTILADKSDTTVDFGFNNSTATYSITDRIWYDSNGDTVYDPDGKDNNAATYGDNEKPLAGVTVNLVKDSNGDGVADSGEPIIATLISADDGTFTFSGVPSDGTNDYVIVISDLNRVLAPLTATTSPAETGYLAISNLAADVDNSGAPNFGYNRPGVIDGTVWSDANSDGVYDSNESGINAITVTLEYDSNNNGIYSEDGIDDADEPTTTDTGGYYEFKRLGSGDYRVVVTPPIGTTQWGDPDTSLDDQTGVTLDFGDGIHHLDFGYQDATRYAVSGTVFHDLDVDGVLEPNGDDGNAGTTLDNEPGISGVTIAIFTDENSDGAIGASDIVIATTMSAADGTYSFTGLANDDYMVAVTDLNGVLDRFELTSGLDQLSVTISGADVTDKNFGYVRDAQTATIGDMVWIDTDSDGIKDPDEPGIANVTLHLLKDSNKNGIIDGGEGAAYQDTVTTDAYGRYLFGSIPAGFYFVDIDETTLPDSALVKTTGTTDPTGLIILSEYEQYRDADFGYTPPAGKATLSGTAWADMDNDGIMDTSEIGIPGVDITIWDVANTIWLGPIATNPDGTWLLTNLVPGSYLIGYNNTDTALDGFVKSPPTNLNPYTGYSITVVADQSVTNLDFGFAPLSGDPNEPGSISGAVYYDYNENSSHDPNGTDTIAGTQDDEKGLDRVTLNLIETSAGKVMATITTLVDGTYSFSGIRPGSNYKVVVDDQNNVLALLNQTELLPASITVSAGATNSGNNAGFIAESRLGTIGNMVWLDNTDSGTVGAWDVGEPGIFGVVIECWHDVNNNNTLDYGTDNLIRKATTEEHGEYYCAGIPTGNYLVYIVSGNSGENGSLNNLAVSYCTGGDCGTSNETRDNYSKVNPFALATASPNLTADFGFKAATLVSSISGKVFNDVNNNASGTEPDPLAHPDAGDLNVEGATVQLYRNGIVILKTTTDVNGDYSFTNLPDGTYDVVVDTTGTSVSGYQQNTQIATNGIITVTLVGPQTSVDNDFGFYRGNLPPTVAVVTSFRSYAENGRVVVEWETVAENGTVGFHLERMDENHEFRRLNSEILPALLTSPTGGMYSYIDAGAQPGKTYAYRLVEVEFKGLEITYGPWTVTAQPKQAAAAPRSMAAAAGAGRSKYGSRPKQLPAPAVQRMKKAAVENARAREQIRDSRNITANLKVLVRRSGIHAVTADALAGYFDLKPDRARQLLNSNSIAVSYAGRPVHTTVSADGNALLFYGAEVESIFTDANVYWLTVNMKNSRTGQVMEKTGHLSVPEPEAGGQSYRSITSAEEQVYPLPWLAVNPRGDLWYWDYIIASSQGTAKSFALTAEGAAATGQACLTPRLKGSYDDPAAPDHRVQLRVNNVDVGEPIIWDGIAESPAVPVCFDQEILNDGKNVVDVVHYKNASVGYSIIFVDGFDLEYQRRYNAVQNSLLLFGDTNETVTVSGFGSDAITVFDLDDMQRPRLVAKTAINRQDDGWSVSFTPETPDTPYLAVTPEAWIIDAEIVVDKPSSLRSSRNRADHIIITPGEFLEAAGELADYRTRSGMLSMAVELEDIYDEFNYGIEDPMAVRRFLAHARDNWLDPPRYVLLAGKGSFDYTDILGMGGNLVPAWLTATPRGLFAGDSSYGDLNNDGVSEFAIGRVPVLSANELRQWTGKLMNFERMAPLGSRAKNILMVADNPDYAGDYHSTSDKAAAAIAFGHNIEKAYIGPASANHVRSALLAGFGNKEFINFFGHGSILGLTHENILTSADIANLAGAGRLPVVVALTCNAGMFEYPGIQSLGEALVLHPGGAIALFAPTGLSANSEALKFDKALMQTLLNTGYRRLGDAVQEARQRYSQSPHYRYMLNIYNLMGDPATLIH